MFDEPDENPGRAIDPRQRAKDKVEEILVYTELAAVFEGTWKFDAQVRPDLPPEIARGVQKTVATLAKKRMDGMPVLDGSASDEARALLLMPRDRDLATGDYYVYRRPGEVMVLRWLAGDEVETFYHRFQAHFDAALEGYIEDERSASGWKDDPSTTAYLDALAETKLSMSDRYLRQIIRDHRVYVMSTLAADELDITYLCEQVMRIDSAELVGQSSRPADGLTDDGATDGVAEFGATESDRAWFFKLFALRGIVEQEERMCFFAFLQKSDDDWP